ncbi:MAG: ABC transporter permease [Eubacteriales bacterium]
MFEHLLRNIRVAAKSVFFHYRQYLCFFCAVFAVQLLYGIVTMAYDNNENIEYRHILEEYNYHLLLKNLNIEQYTYLINGGGAVFSSDKVYEIVEVIELDEPGSYNRKYDFYLRFTGEDLNANYERFKERFGQELAGMSEEGLHYTKTPILNFGTNRINNTAAYLGVSLLLTLLSVFLVTALYHIRINHYKFTYGIYMTFGADFKKLFETSFWEMMTVSVVMLPFSSIISVITDLILFRLHGEEFIFRPAAIFKILLFSLIVSAFAVIYPIWRISRRHPMSLIIAEDNSNLIISPRMSFEMYGTSFPLKYEIFGLWRFRKYYVQLFATAVIFAALFVCSAVWAQFYTQRLNFEEPQFIASFADTEYINSYSGEMSEEIYSIDGVTRINKEQITLASETKSHILVSASDTSLFSNLVVYNTAAGDNISDEISDTKNLYASNDIAYLPCDAEVIGLLQDYQHIGDLSSLLKSEHTVIISDSINNSRVFKLKSGDKIRVAVFTDKIRDADAMVSGHELLKNELRFYQYTYYEFTVGAVLKNNPTYEYAALYMSDTDYTMITGNSVEYKTAEIYADRLLTPDKIRNIENALREWTDLYGNISITNTHAANDYMIEYGKSTAPQLAFIGIIILFISPLIWFFSQVIFYLKRENELYVLEMLGALRSDIKRIYIIDGIFTGVASSIIYILFSITGTGGMYKLMNVVITRFSQDFSVHYMFGIPVLPFITGLLLTAACGFLSAYLPYMFYIKKRAGSAVSEEILSPGGGL